MSYKIAAIDHDADAGIAVQADTLEELFRASAIGMLDIVLDRGMLECRELRLVPAHADSVDILLVNFLSEILALVQVDRFAVCEVAVSDINDNTLIAEVLGQRELPADSVKTEIKLVTYHQLDAHRDDSGKWHARVIFDL